MGSLMKSALQVGAATVVLLAGIAVAAPEAGATATGDRRDCVPSGGVVINGGEMRNTTNLDLSADGGTAIGDASGGDSNLAVATGNDKRNNDKRNPRSSNSIQASAGTGGNADASANGGAISVGDVNSGGNVGNAISVGNTFAGCVTAGSGGGGTAAVQIDGGRVINETNIKVSAEGGTAFADASGGDNNVAIGNGRAGSGGTVSAGNGGTATASADGGVIEIGNINSGGNQGNIISVGDTIVGRVPVPEAPPIKPVPKKPVPTKPAPKKPAPKKPAPGKKAPAPVREIPKALPDTGTGNAIVQGEATYQALALLAASMVMAAAAGHHALRARAR